MEIKWKRKKNNEFFYFQSLWINEKLFKKVKFHFENCIGIKLYTLMRFLFCIDLRCIEFLFAYTQSNIMNKQKIYILFENLAVFNKTNDKPNQ
jgi:hypothetical protein